MSSAEVKPYKLWNQNIWSTRPTQRTWTAPARSPPRSSWVYQSCSKTPSSGLHLMLFNIVKHWQPRRVIDIFDDDGNGEVDFKEFIMGLSHFRFDFILLFASALKICNSDISGINVSFQCQGRYGEQTEVCIQVGANKCFRNQFKIFNLKHWQIWSPLFLGSTIWTTMVISQMVSCSR